MSIDQLLAAIKLATEQGGAYGQNLHPSKEVVVRVSGIEIPITHVRVGFVEGEFKLVLDAR